MHFSHRLRTPLAKVFLFHFFVFLRISLIKNVVCNGFVRFRERRLRNRPAESKTEEGGKEEKVESAPEGKKEEKGAEGQATFDFGTLPVEEAAPEKKAEVVVAPKKAAKIEEPEEAEEAEGLSIEV